MCERDLETEQKCNILTPTLMAISVFFSPVLRGPTLLGTGFLYLSPSGLVSKRVFKPTDFLSSPSYIIVQLPTQYLWNGMFDRHQAEMQFTGHSLPVHQSMTAPWDFTLSHIVSQARLRQWNMQLRVFGMACLAGSMVNIQHSYHTVIYGDKHPDRLISSSSGDDSTITASNIFCLTRILTVVHLNSIHTLEKRIKHRRCRVIFCFSFLSLFRPLGEV